MSRSCVTVAVVQKASEFLNLMGPDFNVGNVVMVAPNTADFGVGVNLAGHSANLTLVHSNSDRVVRWLMNPRGHRSFEAWKGNLLYGYNLTNVNFRKTSQRGHGVRSYLDALRDSGQCK